MLVQLLIGLGGCAAVGLWVENTDSFTLSTGNVLSNAGRILALIGGYLIAVQLLLMARIPRLDRTIGTQRLAAWHATIGKSAVIALCAHAFFITWGYGATVHRSFLAQTGRLWRSYPDVLMATVALGLLIMVGVMSVRAARSRLKYETWYLVHLYTYLAIGLAFAHSFANGAEFSRSLRNRIIWSTLYVVAIGSVIVFRFVIPLIKGLRRKAVVERVVRESAEVTSVHLRMTGTGAMQARPGQFVRLRFLTKDGWWQSHPFSLSAPVDGQRLRITAKAVGDHTSGLAGVKAGAKVYLAGPYGALTAERRRNSKVLLVAGGIGITPLLPLLRTLEAESGELTLIYRASDERSLALSHEVEAAAARTNATVHYVLGPRGATEQADPLTAERLAALVPDLEQHDVFLCGPTGLVEKVTAALRSRGVSQHSIHVEQFAL